MGHLSNAPTIERSLWNCLRSRKRPSF